MTSSPTMHRLHLATQAQQIRDTLPEVEDAYTALHEMHDLVYRWWNLAYNDDMFGAHQVALQLAAHSLRLAEWAEGVGE